MAGVMVVGATLAACNSLAQAPSTHEPTAAPGMYAQKAFEGERVIFANMVLPAVLRPTNVSARRPHRRPGR